MKESQHKKILKATLLIKLGEHFMNEVIEDRNMANSTYGIRKSSGGEEQGSMIHIDIFHYGIENYYGKEIADLIKEIMEDKNE